MTNPRRPLLLNVGFLISAAVGTSRDFTFDYEKMRLGDDLAVTDFIGTATFSRTQQGLLLQGEFSAKLGLECVRCLEAYTQAISWTFTDLYAFDKHSLSESNLLVPEEGRIDLAPLLREYALLEVPIQPVCKPDCKGLCPECGENLNRVDCGHRPAGDESPFAALKDLLK
ncbi:MAG: DUF177 domain-containing protein [Chloroflexota bacterium]